MDEIDRKLPLPAEQLHYADPAINDEAQSSPIRFLIDRIHYPTLGCPALLTPERTLDVVLSLPEGADASRVALSLLGDDQVSVPELLRARSARPARVSRRRRQLGRVDASRATRLDAARDRRRDGSRDAHGVFMHHDPRGGSEGRRLGYYHRFRRYAYDNLPAVVVDYLRYFARYGSRG